MSKTKKQMDMADQLLDTNRRLQLHAQRLALLNEMAAELNQAAGLDEVYKIAATKTSLIVDSDRVSLALPTASGEAIEICALDGEQGSIPFGTQLPVEGTALGEVIRNDKVLIVADIREADYLEFPKLAKQGIRSVISVPLKRREQVIGALNLGSNKVGAFEAGRDESLVLQIASLLGSTIENHRLLNQVHERAAALEETERFLSSVIEHLPLAVFVKDAQHLKFVHWNKSSEALFGFSRQQVLGKSDYDLFPEEQADLFAGKDREVLAGDQPVDIPEESIRVAGGETHFLHTLKVPIMDADGKPKYLLVTSQDITHRKQVEEALRSSQTQLSEALELARLAYWEFDVESHTFTFNDQAYALFRTTAEQEGGYQMSMANFIQKFVQPEDVSEVGVHIQQAFETQDPDFFTRFETRMRWRDGSEGYIAVQIKAVKDEQGRTVKLYGTNQDITDVKRAEQIQAKRAAELACLNEVGREIAETPSISELLQWVTERIPPAMQYPELCRVAIEYEGRLYGQPEAKELPRHIIHGLYEGTEMKGRVYIAYTENRDFLDEESALLGGVANRLSGYIENRRLFEETQERARREQRLREVADRVRGSVDVDMVMRTAAEEVGRVLGRPVFVRLGNGGSQEKPVFVTENHSTESK